MLTNEADQLIVVYELQVNCPAMPKKQVSGHSEFGKTWANCEDDVSYMAGQATEVV